MYNLLLIVCGDGTLLSSSINFARIFAADKYGEDVEIFTILLSIRFVVTFGRPYLHNTETRPSLL